ncbi:DUF5606 domain-containing protein [Flavobacterium sediminilitoris]|uniref:DUF5606 domain-containing protein n=1 Tax=Flavobacterium sediminilitoris TaxID=2024526 RepID=A0ABY4HLU9_9FLAO|nr:MULTISPECIES: DUF5606 domain-containing protein [Flavobacterium]UOX33648.1 DUF5606 domain-containing protein [Flavobacterium sediminilitoris]
MSIQKILAISGKPGLYELKIQTRTGFVAESLLDGKKITVGMRSNVSLLSEIAVYTYSEEIRLADVFKAIATKENDGAAISHKENDATLKDYFREVLPEFDEDRVYTSDIKKIVNWYNILQPKGFVSVEALSKEEEKEETAE